MGGRKEFSEEEEDGYKEHGDVGGRWGGLGLLRKQK